MEVFSKRKKELQIKACSIPQHAPINANPDIDTEEQVSIIQDKLIELPKATKNKLSSGGTGEKILKIGTSFNLELLQIASIARAIRSYYFGELKLEDMPFVLAKEMNIDLTKAQEIAQTVITKIINDDSQERAYRADLENLLIPEALKRYPDLGEQLITENRIKIKSFPEPARPSLKNWLADYIMIVGREKHGAVERGSYLFQSENGKNLSTTDRQRMSYLLKCLDENTPVTINKNTKQIIFPKNSENTSNQSGSFSAPIQSPIEPKNNIQSIQFSYPQKTPAPKPQAQPNIVAIPKTPVQNQTISNRNIVNLKD